MIYYRGRKETMEQAIKFEVPIVRKDIIEVLDNIFSKEEKDLPAECIVACTNNEFHMTDIDFHGVTVPDAYFAEIINVIETLSPEPTYRWQTHGGGIRAVFVSGGFSSDTEQEALEAEHLELICRTHILQKLNIAGITAEKANPTRHPRSVKEGKKCKFFSKTNQYSGGYLSVLGRSLMSIEIDGPSDETINDWLKDRDMKIGKKHTHDHCIIDPTHKSTNAPSVAVNEFGIYCFSCACRLGGKEAFRSWAQILPQITPKHGNDILAMIKNYIHYPQVDMIVNELFEDEYLQATEYKIFWETLLRYYHGKKMTNRIHKNTTLRKINEVIYCDEKFVRLAGGGWTDRYDCLNFNHVTARMPSWYKRLPTLYNYSAKIDADGKEEITKYYNNTSIDFHLTLSGHLEGYPRLLIQKAAPIFGIHNKRRDTTYCVQEKANPDSRRPRYLPKGNIDRLEYEQAWDELEKNIPGVLELKSKIELIYVGRGYAEAKVGMIPLIHSVGPSGSGKTIVAMISCSLVGGEYTSAELDSKKMRSQMLEMADSGLIVLDEFAKGSYDDVKARRDFILGLGWSNTGHKMGKAHSAPYDLNSLILINDIYFPTKLFDDEKQWTRRMVYCEYPKSIPMLKSSCAGYNPSALFMNNSRGDYSFKNILSSIHSHLVDNFFCTDRVLSVSFMAAANELGFPLMCDLYGGEKSAMGTGIGYVVRQIIKSICKQPAITDTEDGKLNPEYRELQMDTELYIILKETVGEGIYGGSGAKRAEAINESLAQFSSRWREFVPELITPIKVRVTNRSGRVFLLLKSTGGPEIGIQCIDPDKREAFINE